MNLIIVESPTKARTLMRFLGGSYDVEATMGHIKDLPKSKLGVDIKHNFKPDYALILKKEDIVKKLKVKSQKSKVVFLATDPDREGEAIAQHVSEVLVNKGLEPSKETNPQALIANKLNRIVFHEITKEAVEEAIAHPRDIDENLVDAQIGRRVLDRLVGYELSPLLWRKVRRGLSAGRVQTVTVKLIVEREREIRAFKPQEYWEIFCEVKGASGSRHPSFVVQLIKIGEKKAEIKDGKTAKEIVSDLEKAKYKVLSVDKHEVRKNPYPPFTTSTMTQAAVRLFFWSAKRTMSIAQKLYEEGLITYHRTDSTNIASVAIDKVRNLVKKKFGENYLPEVPRIYKTTSKVAQEAHEAIRPTNPSYQLLATSYQHDAKRLYDLIWRRFVACQMAASVYDETTIDVEAKLHATYYMLRATGQIMKFDGWRKVIPVKTTSGVGFDSPDVNALPEVSRNDPLQLIKVDSFQKFTEPPSRYNEAYLIKTLEKLGIGRPSTYAPIISTIQIRQYVEKEEGKFIPTPVGFAVNDFLVENFPDVFEYAFTAEMENNLDEVANGNKKWTAEIKAFWNPFSKKLETVTEKSKRVKIETEKLGRVCPECKQGELVVRIGRFGKFVSCSRFPECKYTEKYVEKVGMKCPECKAGDVVIKKTKTGRSFYGCSRYPDCRWASWRKPVLTGTSYLVKKIKL